MFYAGDTKGNIYVISKKGKVLNDTQLEGKIITIVNWSEFSIHVHTSTGCASFSDTTKDFKRENLSSTSTTFSYDKDGTLHNIGDKGMFKVTKYLCGSPIKAIATVGIEFGETAQSFTEVFAYAIIDEEYMELIDEGAAETTLVVYSKNIFRVLEFQSPVKQVMSCRHHESGAESDKIYILLWNGNILKVRQAELHRKTFQYLLLKVTASLLEDPTVPDDALDLTPAINSQEEEDYKGFSVFGRKLCIYGNDGLFTANVMD